MHEGRLLHCMMAALYDSWGHKTLLLVLLVMLLPFNYKQTHSLSTHTTPRPLITASMQQNHNVLSTLLPHTTTAIHISKAALAHTLLRYLLTLPPFTLCA